MTVVAAPPDQQPAAQPALQPAARLSPEHYQPAWVPPEVRELAGRPDTLGVGRPGKVGLMELAFERVGRRTELVASYQKTPLQIMRPLYFDPHRPDLPITFLMATGGGVLQADRLRLDVRCGADSAIHLTTQAATKVYRMEQDYAAQQVFLTAGPGAYVEYLPEMTIPFARSRFYQRTVCVLDPGATLLTSECVMAGRLARGERHAYDIFASDLEVRRPDGSLAFLDTVRLRPEHAGVTGPAVMAGHDLMASFFAVTPLAPAGELADVMHTAMDTAMNTAMNTAPARSELLHGTSVLPDDSGAWLRILGSDPIAMAAALHAVWDAARQLLIGAPAPHLRKA